MSDQDQLQRFIFEHTQMRGVLAGAQDAYQQVLERHAYPQALGVCLGEMLAAVALLSSTLKFEGRLSLMAQGNGPVSLMVAECNYHHGMRALARWDGELHEAMGLQQLIGEGHLVITIEPDQGQRYQGIVPLAKAQLAQCLEDYFEQSEQLQTRIFLAADLEHARGLLLQAMPGEQNEQREEDWARITHLGATLSSQELLELDNATLLHRLFHEESVRVFDPQTLQFDCECSRERSLKALRTLSASELQQMLDEDGQVLMNCQFCNETYAFTEQDLLQTTGVETEDPPLH